MPANSVNTTSGAYGKIIVDHFDKNDVLDESKRCREALREAQVAASEFGSGLNLLFYNLFHHQ